MSARSSKGKTGRSAPKEEGFTFKEAPKPTEDAGVDGFAVEPVGKTADQSSDEESKSEKSASYFTDDPSAGLAAQAYNDIKDRDPPQYRRPARRSLDKRKVVTTPDSGAKVHNMEALLTLMDAGSRAQYLAWEEMYEVAKREGNESRASRAESRMADLESKVFGILSSPPVVGTSSGSSSGDSAAVAASVDAVLSARAGDAAAKKTLASLESALDKQLSASAPVKKYQGAIALDTKSARFTQALEALMMAVAGVIPKGPTYAEILRQVVPLDLPLLSDQSVNKVNDKAAEVAQSLEDVRLDVEAEALGSTNPYIQYLRLLHRKAEVVIKDCEYLKLIDGRTRQAIFDMFAPMWELQTSVKLSSTALETIERVYAALGYSEVALYNLEVKKLTVPPLYKRPVGEFPMHKLILQMIALYQRRMQKFNNLNLPTWLHQFALVVESLPSGTSGSPLQYALTNFAADCAAFIHSPPGASEEHVLNFLDAMLKQYANKPFEGGFILKSDDKSAHNSAFLGVQDKSPWESTKKSKSKAPEAAEGKDSGKKQHPAKEARPKQQEQKCKVLTGTKSSKSSAKMPAKKSESSDSDSDSEESGAKSGSGTSDSERSQKAQAPARVRNGSPQPWCNRGTDCRYAKQGKCYFPHPEEELEFLQGRVRRCDDGASCKRLASEEGCDKYHSRAELQAIAPKKWKKVWGSRKYGKLFEDN
jgi:hypothetical protein